MTPRVQAPEARELAQAHSGFYAPATGRRFDYELFLELRYQLVAQAEAAHSLPRANATRLAGRFAMTILAQRQNELLVGCTMQLRHVQAAEPRVKPGRGGAGRSEHKLSASDEDPCVLRINRDGRILGYAFPRGWTALERNTMRSLTSGFCFVVEDGDRTTWNSEEADATGTFVAKYERLAKRDGVLHLRKRRLRYVELDSDFGEKPKHEISGAAQAWLALNERWLTRAKVDERLEIDLPVLDCRMHLHSRGDFELRETTQSSRRADAGAWERCTAPARGQGEDLSSAEDERAELQAWREKLKGVEIAQILEELEKLLAGGKHDSEQSYLTMQKLMWLVRIRPRALSEVDARLRDGRLKGVVAAWVLTAIAEAGTDAAQALLGQLVSAQGHAGPLGLAAIEASMQVHAPRKALLDRLAQRLEGVQSVGKLEAATLLSLGALAGRAEGEVRGPTDSVARLLGFGERARSLGATATWLEALGNSKDPRVESAARRFLDSPSPEVRRAAVSALRRLSSASSLASAVTAAQRDPDPRVRRRAVEVLAERGEGESLRALRGVLGTERDANIRHAALMALIERSSDRGRAALEFVAQRDPSPELRRFARSKMHELRSRRG